MYRYRVETIARLTALVLAGFSLAANAAEISVLSAGAVKAAFSVTVAAYERLSGHHFTVEYLPVGSLMRRLSEGAKPDLVVLTAEAMTQAAQQQWVMPAAAVELGSVGIGVAIEEHAMAPDISSPEALKQTLLAAKSITYIDPDKGTSGKHFAEVLKRLGIADEVKANTRLGDAGYVVEPVARGEIELGIQQVTEILPVQGVKLIGLLPEPLQKITIYSVAPTPSAHDPRAGQDFMVYLRSASARRIFSNNGFSTP